MGLYSVAMAEEDNAHPPADQLPDNLKPPTPGQLRQYNFETWFTTDPSAKVTFIIILNLGCVFILTVLFFLCNCLHQMSGMHRFLELMWMAFGKIGRWWRRRTEWLPVANPCGSHRCWLHE